MSLLEDVLMYLESNKCFNIVSFDGQFFTESEIRRLFRIKLPILVVRPFERSPAQLQSSTRSDISLAIYSKQAGILEPGNNGVYIIRNLHLSFRAGIYAR